jgi:hypothetical protein
MGGSLLTAYGFGLFSDNSGGTSGGLESPMTILGSDFTTATEWNDSRIGASWSLKVFFNDSSKFLKKDVEWERTATGIRILIDGFNALLNPSYEFEIFIYAL